MTVKTIIQDGLIESITLYKPKLWFLRLDVLPFILTYVIASYFILQDGELKFPALIAFPIGLTAQLFVFLLAQSSVAFRCFIGKTRVTDIKEAVDIHVRAAKNAGKDRLVNLLKMNNSSVPLVGNTTTSKNAASGVKVLGVDYSLTNEIFFFQEVMYCYQTEEKTFKRLDYPTTFTTAESFLKWQGYDSNDNILKAYQRWGINEFNIPMPHFLDLYMEHLVAPFFVFQVLCLFLWSLDDYWYYSAFTLFMLMLFEGVMCNQRQNSVLMMRNMRRPPYKIFVYRSGQWLFHNTDIIFPGDIISITADQTIYQSDITENGLIRKRKPENNYEGKVIPCDILLIRGSCVVNEAMLTGESIPKVKEYVNKDDTDSLLNIDITKSSSWNRHLLLGGTLIQQHSNPMDPYTSSSPLLAKIPPAPDGGCIGIVIRSGFATTQGELMRKILFATEGTTGNSKETFGFIAVLVLFAIFAAAAVLQEGVHDERRNKFRLALHCIMIITSVVPPELPMELSLAVTNSLAALGKQMIYCTEPYRIPFAGKLDVICFDKTGTLTKDEMVLKGIVAGQDIDIFTGKKRKEEGEENNAEEDEMNEAMISPDTTTDFVQLINGTCHDLVERQMRLVNNTTNDVTTSGEILGDPLEIASFSTSGFQFTAPPATLNQRNNNNNSGTTFSSNFLMNPELEVNATLLQKYPFNSELKRMSTIVHVKSISNSSLSDKCYLFTKGAPEILHQYLAVVPPSYNDCYQHHMQAGKRVLALAYKPVPLTSVKSLNRQTAEKDLLFAGFLVFDCDLKADSRSVIKDLLLSKHQVVMITGDSVYTAANVGKRIALYEKEHTPLILTIVKPSEEEEETEKSNDKNKKKTKKQQEGPYVVWRRADSDNGDSSDLHEDDVSFDVNALVPLVKSGHVLCVSGPALDLLAQQNSSVLKSICSHITIFARVSPAQKEKIIHAYNDIGLFTLMCGDGTNDVGALKAAHVGVSVINNPKLENRVEDASKGNNKKGKLGGSNKDRLARAMLELQEHEADPTIVKLGDASIASPFTAKRTSIDSVLTVIRQGRCTLVGTIQVSVNPLISSCLGVNSDFGIGV